MGICYFFLCHWTQLDSILLTGIFNHKHEVNMRNTFMYAPTFLPALLLCLFMTARGLFPLALASVNCSENLLPNLMLLLQPDQVQPLFVTPLCERSQSQLSVFPALHEAVTAWATPAAVMACRYADSRLAERAMNKDNYLNWKKYEKIADSSKLSPVYGNNNLETASLFLKKKLWLWYSY